MQASHKLDVKAMIIMSTPHTAHKAQLFFSPQFLDFYNHLVFLNRSHILQHSFYSTFYENTHQLSIFEV